jgi:oligopeptidase B
MQEAHLLKVSSMCRTLFVPLILTVGLGAEPMPPAAKKVPVERKLHGDTLVDNYRWLQDKKSAEVIDYLNAENTYTEAKTKHLKTFENQLYTETLARIKQTDLSVPTPNRGYLYYSRTEKGKQYSISCRKKNEPKAGEEVLLDGNELAKGHKFFSLGGSQVSDDTRLLAYASDVTGFREYYLSIKDLKTGKFLEERKRKTSNFIWASDNKTIFYVTEDAAKRAHKLWRHIVGTDSDELIYEEKDELFRLGISRSRDRKYLIASSRSSTTTEVRLLRADQEGTWQVIRPREDGHEYTVDVRHDTLWIRTNKNAKGFRVVTTPLSTDAKSSEWKEFFPHKDGVTIENLIPFANYIVLAVRENGLRQIDVYDTETKEMHRIDWPEPVFTAFATPTPEFDTPTLRLSYTSLVTPQSVFDYDMKTRKRTLLKKEEVQGEYDPAHYTSERIWATAKDGTKVPISLVYKKGTKLDGTAALWLSGYGSYGASRPVSFSATNLPILDRGVILATAHIRGGGDMGKTWHDDGKMMKKKNTFTDFIDCADYLIEKKYTSRDRLAIEGGSAGGLLMGAVINMRPDLCKVVVLGVPFVDVINTMMDPSLPLTIQEYLEWGNPNKKDEYEYMKSYCPYTNLKAIEYPAMLVQTSLNDSQVMYWEPAKYVAKLRTVKQGRSPLLFKINMAGGHGGSSGRYDFLREQAFKKAFVLEQIGVKP